MSGTRLVRGRGGRLAIYGGSFIALVLLVFLYHNAATEMTRLRDLNDQCTHQGEALATQLQVIFEYKTRLEKSLSEGKTSNIALKQELQERDTREKTLRDKDIEALHRYNSLQQQHKILQTEHQDLKDEYKKQEQALIETSALKETLDSQIKKTYDDKENLKTKYFEIQSEKEKLENKYNDLIKTNGNTDSTIQHLTKQVFQLRRELEDTKLNCKSTFSGSNLEYPKSSVLSAVLPSVEKSVSPSQHQQINSSTSIRNTSIAVNVTKSTFNLSTTLSSKSSDIIPVASSKSLPRLKLPIGVVPIPKMIDSKIDKEDPKQEKTGENNSQKDDKNNEEKARAPDNEPHQWVGREGGDGGGIEVAGRRPADSLLKRQESPAEYKVQPGVQEIGDNSNHPGRLQEVGDTGLHPGGEDHYDNLDYYKEPQPKNNDIHLDEGEEDEGEDEDEQADYQNHLQGDKHE